MPHLFHLNKGYALLNSGDYESAIEANKKGLAIYPHYLDFTYNIGIVHRDQGNYPEEMEIMQKVLDESPFYKSAHFELAMLSLRENSTARALMCLNIHMMLQEDVDKGNNVLSLMEHLATSKKDSVPKGLFADSQEDFSRVDLILDNGIALQKGYDIGFKESLATFRQNHALFTGLTDGQHTEGGFWSELYVPFFKALMDDGQFSNYCYFLLQFSASESHKKMAAKKLSDIQEFNAWRNNYVQEHWLLHEENGQSRLRTFHENSVMDGIGPFDMKSRNTTGDWLYYGENGRLSAEGGFSEGKRDGRWVWFDVETGSKTTEADFSMGDANGEIVYYHLNGKRKTIDHYKNRELDGRSESFGYNGKRTMVKDYEKQLMSGVEMNYYVNGDLADSSGWKEGKMEGRYLSYYPNGARKLEGNAKNGKSHGEVIGYYANGQVESVYIYENGLFDGPGKQYHANGALAYEGEYKNGNRIGVHTSYRLDGSKENEAVYDENGKENGQNIEYDYEGRPRVVLDYTKGNIVAYSFLDEEGKEVRKAKKKGSSFEYKGLNFNGTEQSEGIYDFKGGKQGEWKFYDEDGILKSVVNFKDNVADGRQQYFHTSGKLEYDYEMKEGKFVGEHRRYYSDGSLRRHGMSVDGDSEGAWYTYFIDGGLARIDYYMHDELLYYQDYDVDGGISSESYYEDSRLIKGVNYDADGGVVGTFKMDYGNGPLEFVHVNGQKKVDGHLVEGLNDGPYRYYEANGQVNAEGEYQMDQKQGTWSYYHENGQLQKKEVYNYGDLNGDYQAYDWFGVLEVEGQFELGDRSGEWKFYENGDLTATSTYVNGQLHGERRFMAPSGDLQMVRYYDHDRLTSYSYEGADGKLVEPIPINVKKDELVSYFPNGNKAREYKMTNGEITGDLIEYMPDGSVSYLGPKIGERQHGIQKFYYVSGQVNTEYNYENGLLEGMSTTYWPNGKKRLEIPYRLGNKHGEGTEYKEDGSVLKRYTFFNGILIK